MTVVTPTDRPKSVRDRCVLEVFGGVYCVVALFLAHPSQRLKWAIVKGKREVPRGVRNSKVRRQDKFKAHRQSASFKAHRLSVRPSSSVRKLSYFQLLLPEPLDGFWWNLVGMKYSWSLTSVVVLSVRSAQGRIQGEANIGGPLLQETSSSDRKATGTNQMDRNDLESWGKKCCYFLFHSEVKCLTRFWRLFWH